MSNLIRTFLKDESGFLPALIAGIGGAFSAANITSLATGALTSMAGGAISGHFDKKAEKRAAAYEDPAAIRARYEKAGFNPLLAFNGNGAGTRAPGVSSGVAADSIISAAFDRDSNTKIANAQIEQENERLNMLNRQLALKAPSGGVYTENSTRNGVGGATAAADGDLPFGQAADADTVYEIESDAYLAGIKGKIVPWTNELGRRNNMGQILPDQPLDDYFNLEKAPFRLVPGGPLDNAYRAWKGQDKGSPEPRHDVWRSQNYGSGFNPTGWR